MAVVLQRYDVPRALAATVYFPVYAVGTDTLYTGAALAAADVTYSIDGAAAVTPSTNNPTQIGATGLWFLTMAVAETTGDQIIVKIIDAAIDPVILVFDTRGGAFTCLEGSEPTTAIANNSSFKVMMQHFKRRFFNKVTQTVTSQIILRDDSTTTLESRTVANDGTTQSVTKVS